MYSPVPQQYRKAKLQPADLLVIGLFIFLLYGSVITAQRWSSELQPDIHIDLSYSSLFLYSVYSLFRASLAYVLSLIFTLVFGYLAAKYKTAERLILPLLDIGQSIPVLGFLPGLVLGLIAIFPNSNLGLELACIFMIFTGQVWNMTFSFYSSVKSVPKHFHELSANVQLNFFQKFYFVELPYSSSGLAWNSLMSMAGGWFFLTVCEAFTLGDKVFRLPGLGSYMAVAIEQGNSQAMIGGVTCMIAVIVGMDFFVWRPIIAWTRRFQLDEQQDAPQELPYFQKLIQDSKIVRKIESFFLNIIRGSKNADKPEEKPEMTSFQQVTQPIIRQLQKPRGWLSTFQQSKVAEFLVSKISWIVFSLAGVWISAKLYVFLQPLEMSEWILIFKSTFLTFARVVFTLVVATLWAVPFGVWVGLSQKRTQFFQPLIQVAASFPAPMLYPIVLAILAFCHIGIGFGSSILMLLGVQWYVLFNVLAGTTMISRELRDTFSLIGLSRWDTWKKLFLPSIFPALVTGWVTAAGGAWNASIVAEFIQYKGETLKAVGLGALISDATSHANYSLLAGALLVMVMVVVGFNRSVWHRFYQLVERRFKFER
jgi:NitT/TauT family transport system permease protein